MREWMQTGSDAGDYRYQIGWKRSIPGCKLKLCIKIEPDKDSLMEGCMLVELEGIVEFKSLPSGLHNVREDLVYFVHDKYAGISAFVNEPTSAEERNALMLAVGVLVPLSYGRLGRSWRHAKQLKELAR